MLMLKKKVLLPLIEKSFSKFKNKMTKFLIFIIKIYQYFVSPFLGNRCRFLPTCSEYFIEALNTQGLFKGIVLGIKDLLSAIHLKN